MGTMIDFICQYSWDLHQVLPPALAATVLVLVSVICGLVIGQEREAKDKPAGLRTVTLICVGSTIFTLGSLLIRGPTGDPGRIAAQIVTGIGFLGAGAIIRDRGTIVGLTTGATIWATAAIGLLIGAGYAAGGIALTLVVLGTLQGAHSIETWVQGPCRWVWFTVRYRANGGKTHLRVFQVLDEYRVPDADWSVKREGEHEVLRIRCCVAHRNHRAFLLELGELNEVEDIDPAPVWHRLGDDAGSSAES